MSKWHQPALGERAYRPDRLAPPLAKQPGRPPPGDPGEPPAGEVVTGQPDGLAAGLARQPADAVLWHWHHTGQAYRQPPQPRLPRQGRGARGESVGYPAVAERARRGPERLRGPPPPP